MSAPAENPQTGISGIDPMVEWEYYNRGAGKRTQTINGRTTCQSCYDKPTANTEQTWQTYSQHASLGGGNQQQDFRQNPANGSSQSVFDTAQSRYSPQNTAQYINF